MRQDAHGVVMSTETSTVRGGASRMLLAGVLDDEVVDRISALLDDLAGPGVDVVVDLSRSESLPLGVLRALVAAHRRLQASGGSLVVTEPSAAARRVLRTSGLHSVLQISGWPAPVENDDDAAETA